jgi:hypothetical protein
MTDQATELLREAIKNGIRTFCESLGARVVTASSDGVERIYYSGLSLDALSVAATMAALTRPPSERPVAQVREGTERLAEKLSRIVLQMERTGDWRLSEPEAITIKDAAQMLRALTAERPEAAVAWRYRAKGNPTWTFASECPDWAPLNPEIEFQPLYAHEEPGRETMTSVAGDDGGL